MQIKTTPELDEFRSAVEKFAAGIVRPALADLDMNAELSRADFDRLWDRLFGHGFLEEIPRTEAGDIDWLAVGTLMEVIASTNPSLAFMVVETLVMPAMVWDLLDQEQRDAYGHLFSSRTFMSGAFSEAGAGSNPNEIRTRARREGDHWVLNGTKIWSSGASHSDSILVACLLEDDASAEPQFGLLLVDRASSPYITRNIEMLGLRAHALSEVFFDDVRVPLHARVGAGRSGQSLVQGMLQRARSYLAVNAVGIAQRALDLSVEYSKVREQFGKPIGSFQLVQQLLAEMAIDVRVGRLAAFNAFNVLMAGERGTLEVSTAKAFCTEMAQRVTSKAIQVHGAFGLSSEGEVEGLFRDARMTTIPDGTTQIHMLIIGRALTGLNALT